MDIFELERYKDALQVYIIPRRQVEKGLYRKLAEHLGVHPTMVSQILSGSKDFSEEQIILVCEYLGISKLETQYILVLLQQERAGSKKLKDYFQELKEQTRRQASVISERVSKNRQLSDTEKAVFYSSWIYSAIHLLTTLDNKLRFEQICARLDLPPRKVQAILNFLMEINMVELVDGCYSSGPVATHLEKSSPQIVKHHTNWRLKAIQHAEFLSDQELMYSAPISISRKDFERLRQEFLVMIQKFVETVRNSPAEDIAQLNLDFFWIRK